MDGQPVPVGLDLEGAALFALVVMVVLTPVVTAVVLWRYRRAIQRSMSSPSRPSPVIEGRLPPRAAAAPASADRAPTLQWQVDDGRGRAGGATPLEHVARAAARRAAAVHVVAAASYIAVATTVYLSVNGLEFYPGRFAVIAGLFAWPLLPTLFHVLVADRRLRAMLVSGYVGLLLAVGVLSGADAGELLLLAAIEVVPPALLVAALASPRLRAAGPFLAPVLFGAGLTFAVWPWLAWPLVMAGLPLGAAAVLVWALCLAGAVLLTLAYLRLIARRYADRRSSDRGLLIAQWWLLATLWLAVSLVPSGSAWFWVVAFAFGVHQLVVAAGLRLARLQPAGTGGVRLLLLRTFGSRNRSEGLLRELNRSWRYLGSVQLIAGVDLVSANLEPHEFLEFLQGRVARRFIRDEPDLTQRLADRDLDPDPDGRYRVNEFFCHDDTWRPTVQRLARDSDAVLMDLRGFTGANAGVRYELEALVDLVALQRVVLVFDASTDRQLVWSVVDGAWQALPAGSPNRGRPVTTVRLVALDRADANGSARLLHALCEAASPAQPAAQPHHLPTLQEGVV